MTVPFVKRGAMNNWPASGKWTFDFFYNNFGNEKVYISNTNFSESYEVSLGEYLQYVISSASSDNDVLYLRDWDYSHLNLDEDVKTPSFIENLLDGVSSNKIPKLKWIYIGPSGSGTPLHQDTMGTHAWNGLFEGEKKWVFFSENQIDFLYNGQVDAFNPDYEKYPLFRNTNPIYLVQKPNDIVYTPSGWWHQVINTKPSIAITENFVDRQNIKKFLNEILAH